MPDETVEVYRCDFEDESDTNFDLWPDGWTRRRGRGYPSYVNVAISDNPESAARGTRFLQIDLDGGAVSLYSPFIEVSPLFSYTLRGHLRTSGLVHDSASMEVIFYDEDRKLIQSFDSEQFSDQGDWREILLGPLTTGDQRARWAAIALHLSPSEHADLTGTAAFDDISLGRLPLMSLSTNSEHHIYAPGEEINITCQLSGYSGYEPKLRFELRGVDGTTLATHEETLQTIKMSNSAAAAVRKGNATSEAPHAGFLGASSWQPPVRENGFYQIQVSVDGHRGLRRTVNFVVADPPKKRPRGEFGWSLPAGDKTLSLKALASLLRHTGINWVKFPIWYDNDARAEQFARFAERVNVNNIEMVGMLDQPPEGIRDHFGEGGKLPVASVFIEPEVWNPAIDAMMTRLSLKVRWWQLVDDQDISFVNYPNLEEKLTEIRAGFRRFGQDIKLGTTWRAIDETPFSKSPPITFLSYTADPSLTDNELREFFDADHNENLNRWIVLKPLDRELYSLESRARDLVKRMLAAKMGKADGIFIPDPFDPAHGLMEADGTPGVLLLPWRTTAELLANAEYLGTTTLPNGSSNYVFERDGEAIIVVWNSRPTRETIYLGEHVQQIDLWGRKTSPTVVTDRDDFFQQELEVGPLPTFVTGVNATIAKWRMALEFETKELESVFGQRQRATYHFSNPFEQGVGGSVTLVTPQVWSVDTPTKQFKLSPRDRRVQHLNILLGTNADSGPQPLRLDFNISADRSYRFSVYRGIQVGLGDIEVELESHLDEYGNLVVDQHLTNKTDRSVSFNCLLFVPDRRRERRQVFNLGRGRQSTRFILADGEELIGLTLGLRAEEIGGVRVLNHRIVAEE